MNRNVVRFVVLALLCCSVAFAQDPFSSTLQRVWVSVTGPIARLCTTIGIVFSCLMMMSSRGDGVSGLGRVIIGGTGAMLAVQIVNWLWN